MSHVAHGKAYLDWNATTPIFPEVTDAVLPFISSEFGNPSSGHCFGSPSRSAVARARAQVALLLACTDDEVVFCSCGSEADNMAIRGAVALRKPGVLAAYQRKPHVVSSCIEHPAVTACLDAMVADGDIEVTYVDVDSYGHVDPKAIEAAIRPTTVLVTVMHSNNEVGSVQDIAAIAAAAREAHQALGGKYGLLVHTDAAQSVGKVAVHPTEMGADMATVVGHKFGAPKGVAALFVREGLALPPLLRGGGQEAGRRAGTEAVPQIVALGAAAEVVATELGAINAHMRLCRDLLYVGLAEGLGRDRLRVNGPPLSGGDAVRLPNTLSLGIKGASAAAILDDLSRADVAASASAACHASDVAEASISFVLRAMEVPEEFALGTLRLSVGRHTTEDEVDRAVQAICRSASRNTRPWP